MNILITGSTGFIGTHLVRELSRRYDLFTPSHKELDLLDADKVKRYITHNKIDIVVHCAIVGGNRTEEYVRGMFYTNTRIFFNLLRCEKYFKRMIHIGSGAVYDKRFPIVKAREDDLGLRMPSDEYGFYKYMCAQWINNSRKAVDLRVFGLFGEGEKYRVRFISNALCRYIYKKSIVFSQDVFFDYIYINDFTKIINYFISHTPKYKAYNIGSGKKVNLKTLADYINTLDSYKVKIDVKKRGIKNEYTGDVRRLFSEYRSIRITPIKEAVKELYYLYKKNIKKYTGI